jgi:hypothetical protein
MAARTSGEERRAVRIQGQIGTLFATPLPVRHVRADLLVMDLSEPRGEARIVVDELLVNAKDIHSPTGNRLTWFPEA